MTASRQTPFPIRSALITGAARGIGRAIAQRLAADGFSVTITDLSHTAADLESLAETLRSSGVPTLAAVADVTSAADVQAAVDAHVNTHGGLDVMVANAGIAITAPLVDTTPEQFQTTMDVNVRGVFHCYQAAARQMITQGRGGRLIGAASLASHRGGKWQSAYSASKFAVRGMSQSIAQELAEHQITVNVYSPGIVHTPMWDSIDEALTTQSGAPVGSALQGWTETIPLGRLATPNDVAGVVSFLASPDAAYITGQSIVVDGGLWFS